MVCNRDPTPNMKRKGELEIRHQNRWAELYRQPNLNLSLKILTQFLFPLGHLNRYFLLLRSQQSKFTLTYSISLSAMLCKIKISTESLFLFFLSPTPSPTFITRCSKHVLSSLSSRELRWKVKRGEGQKRSTNASPRAHNFPPPSCLCFFVPRSSSFLFFFSFFSFFLSFFLDQLGRK